MEDIILKIQDLTKNFGKKEVLKSVNLEIKKGDVFGVIGMSGGGKTVLLKTIINFYKPNKGNIIYKGQNVKSFSFRKKFGFSTQESCFYPELTVHENLEHFGRLYRLRKDIIKKRIDDLLNLLELQDAEYMYAGQLSGGMQKRLDIACSLIHEPELLLLDEPTLELDPILRREVMYLLHKINQEKNVTILMASHLLGGIEAMCNNIAIIHQGKIIEQGSPTKLRELHGKNEEIHLKTEPGSYKKIRKMLEKRRKGFHINKIESNGPGLIIQTKDAKKVLDYLFDSLKRMDEKIVDLHLSKPSLTEAFMSLVGGIRESQLKNRIKPQEETKEMEEKKEVKETKVEEEKIKKTEEKEKKEEEKELLERAKKLEKVEKIEAKERAKKLEKVEKIEAKERAKEAKVEEKVKKKPNKEMFFKRMSKDIDKILSK